MGKLAAIGPALQVVGSFSSASAQRKQGKFDQKAYNYQASVARNSAEQADERAVEELAAASREAHERYRELKLAKSRAIAVGGKSGTDYTGTLLSTIEDYEELALLEARSIFQEGKSRAKQYRKQGAALRTDAKNLKYLGKQAKSSANSRSFGTLITGLAGSVNSAHQAGILEGEWGKNGKSGRKKGSRK